MCDDRYIAYNTSDKCLKLLLLLLLFKVLVQYYNIVEKKYILHVYSSVATCIVIFNQIYCNV